MAQKEEIYRYIVAKLAENPLLARDRTHEAGEQFPLRRPYSRIQKHASDFLLGDIENRIIILPGLRGVGKTTLLFQLYRYLTLEKGIDQRRVLYFSVDEAKEYLDAGISDILKVFSEDMLGSSFVGLDKEVFVLIDETHFDKNWSRAAKIVYDQTKKIFLVITGSSALSMEMSADLARRAKREAIFPLDLSEHLLLKHGISPADEGWRRVIFEPDKKSLLIAREVWHKTRDGALRIGKPVGKEFEHFLSSGGFPFSLGLDEKCAYEKIFGMIERIIEKDMFTIHSFRTETRNIITRIIYYLALQHPGETSDEKLSQRIGVSSKTVRSILEVLEKTHLVFSIKPYGGAGRVARKAWKYYFLSPSLNAAIRSKLGYQYAHKEVLGLLAESMVAASFLRMKETADLLTGIYYDAADGGVDFIITQGTDRAIPVEVGFGKKDKSQIKKAIRRHSSGHGIVISGGDDIAMEDNVLFMPLAAFSLL